MTDTLGQLANIAVRELWPNEAADFTPWLARDENMSKLGGALGLELETDRVEVAVGPYSADILSSTRSVTTTNVQLPSICRRIFCAKKTMDRLLPAPWVCQKTPPRP